MAGNGYDPLYEGFNYVADIQGSYGDVNGEGTSQFDGVLADNANAVALTVDYGIDAANNTIYANDYTETDANIANTMTFAVQAGLSVLFRPLIDFLPNSHGYNAGYYDDEFRNDYNPGNASSTGAANFFVSYKAMIVNEATIAQADGAKIFDIGTELDQLTGPAYENYWTNPTTGIIAAVKAVFSGQLTYSAVWDDNQGYWQYSSNSFNNDGETGSSYITGDLTTQVSFWSDLSYVGIDEYAAISDQSAATLDAMGFSAEVATLVKGWTETPTDPIVSSVTGGESLIAYYEGISAATGKPLLFTELGYGDVSDAASTPATPGFDDDGNPDGATADPTLQAALYAAFFEAWKEAGNSSLAGVYLWEYEPGGSQVVPAGTALYDQNGDETYNPYPFQGDTAETQIANGFGSDTTCFVAGTRILTARGEVAVEALRIGDSLKTLHAGEQKIKWIGTRSYDGRFIAGNKAALPIRIKRGAIEADVPARDLFVSPGHAICIDGVLVHASRLVNGVSVTQVDRVDNVTYYHIEMANHEVIFAENCGAETFLGEDFRRQFQNVAEFAALYPGEAAPEAMCLPRLEGGFQLHAIQQRLAARAGIDISAAPVLGPLRGYVDQAGPKICSGWVQDILAPEAPVCLDITADGRGIGRILANFYRADLYEAGLGSGCHGFSFLLPPGIAGRIDAVRAADGTRLAWTESAAAMAA
jgi:hypothetical protein